ncbi:OmpA/MotB family protein [Sulfurospirillum arcachonense]|uniref:OmpA/MotB family protein n=1 Tax=Sulfurospirillum arcachonense TaxID=57666 RepID=UPI000468BCEE|nr:flagellar motor protein MotB [Sulfurospirillum arcachonense]
MAKKCPDCPKCLPQWLAAFGDLMSLLLCFFVLLLSMSTMDAKKIQEAIGSLAGALSVLEGGTKTEISRERQQQATPIESTDETSNRVQTAQLKKEIIEINEILKIAGGPEIQIEEAEDGFIIRLPDGLLFAPGSAVIQNEDALLFLKRIALIIKKLPERLHIKARGHTDNNPPASTSPYKDNWELSTARAVSVVKELIKNRIDPKKIIASGKAQFDPLTSNATPEGRAKNRRVELHFYSLDSSLKKKAQKSVLDSASGAK